MADGSIVACQSPKRNAANRPDATKKRFMSSSEKAARASVAAHLLCRTTTEPGLCSPFSRRSSWLGRALQGLAGDRRQSVFFERDFYLKMSLDLCRKGVAVAALAVAVLDCGSNAGPPGAPS